MIRKIKPSIFLLKSSNSLGSGFVVSKSGHILTCNHVATGDKIEASNSNGDVFILPILARDTQHDLALLYCPEVKEESLCFADPISIAEGQTVFALGHPLGLEFTISRGIISNSEITLNGVSYIQTDTSINPGNSGGPIVNNKGEVVGITDWTLKESQGLSFGVAVRHALAFASQIRIPLKRSLIFPLVSED